VSPGWSSYGAAKAATVQWVRNVGAEEELRGHRCCGGPGQGRHRDAGDDVDLRAARSHRDLEAALGGAVEAPGPATEFQRDPTCFIRRSLEFEALSTAWCRLLSLAGQARSPVVSERLG
jgi:hypothetical protein